MYLVQQERVGLLFAHPKFNSVVDTAALQPRRSHMTPANREGKKIDTAGCKFYSMGELGIKGVSYISCMKRYTYALWEQMWEVLEAVPDVRLKEDLCKKRACPWLTLLSISWSCSLK